MKPRSSRQLTGSLREPEPIRVRHGCRRTSVAPAEYWNEWSVTAPPIARSKAFDPEEALERALDLFWRQGYEATSVAHLVGRLGISRASLYDTFGS